MNRFIFPLAAPAHASREKQADGSVVLECARCGKTGPEVQSRRQNTAYHDDERNWCVLCSDCQQDADEYWAERWAEYHSGLL